MSRPDMDAIRALRDEAERDTDQSWNRATAALVARDVPALLDYIEELERGVCDMFLCESGAVYLQPDRLYRFKVDRNCPRCLRHAEKAALPVESSPEKP